MDEPAEAVAAYLALASDWNAPAEARAIDAGLPALGCAGHATLRAMYERADGARALPMLGDELVGVRLMPLAEAAEVTATLNGLVRCPLGSVAWVFSDDNSNHVGVLTDGSLPGYAVRFDHEATDLSPRWRSCSLFLAACLRRDWRGGLACDALGVPTDLPVGAGGHASELERRVAAGLLGGLPEGSLTDAQLADGLAGCQLADATMADAVLQVTEIDDMWLPGVAARVLGLWRVEAAVPRLESMARSGQPNGDWGAVLALARIDSSASRAALARLASRGSERIASLLGLTRPPPGATASWVAADPRYGF